MRQFPHAQVVDDEQRHGAQGREQGLAGPVESGVSDRLDEGVGLVVEDLMALVDRGPPEGLREMTLAGAGRAEEEGILVLRDETAGGELVDQSAIHLLVKREVKAVERAIGVPEACLLVPPGQQAGPAAGPARRRRGPRGSPSGASRSVWACRSRASRTSAMPGEAELAEGAVEFDEIHDVSPVLRSMRSR